jgi:hypothetical protein
VEQATWSQTYLANYPTAAPAGTLLSPIKVFLEPSRGRIGVATAGNTRGPMTDYAMNVNVTGAYGTNNVNAGCCNYNNKIRLEQITDGTSNTILIGTKAVSKAEYQRINGDNWDETTVIGLGGASRSSGTYRQDPTSGNLNYWGAPYSSGALMGFADGSNRMLSYSISQNTDCVNATCGTVNPFALLLHPSDGIPPPNLN